MKLRGKQEKVSTAYASDIQGLEEAGKRFAELFHRVHWRVLQRDAAKALSGQWHKLPKPDVPGSAHGRQEHDGALHGARPVVVEAVGELLAEVHHRVALQRDGRSKRDVVRRARDGRAVVPAAVLARRRRDGGAGGGGAAGGAGGCHVYNPRCLGN